MLHSKRAMLLLTMSLLVSRAHADTDLETRARSHFELGQGLYRIGDYDGAVKEFAAGYALAPRPRFLINLGHAYRKIGDNLKAWAMYQRFLDESSTDSKDRVAVQAILKELERTLGEEQPKVPAPAVGKPEAKVLPSLVARPVQPSKRRWIWPVVTIAAVAVAAAVAVVVVFATATNYRDSTRAACDSERCALFDGAR